MPQEDLTHSDPVPDRHVRYAYRASAVGTNWQFDLDDAGLHWRAGRRQGVIQYRDVTSVVLSYRPTSMQARRYRMTIRSSKGVRLPVLSVTAKGPALVEPQSADYNAFVLELHRRLAGAGSAATFHAGLSLLVFRTALAASALVLLAMAALLIRSLLITSWGGAFFMVGFGALFVWQIGGFLRRNRPETYVPSQPPNWLLPQEASTGTWMHSLRDLVSRMTTGYRQR
jgi:hypothetical protein